MPQRFRFIPALRSVTMVGSSSDVSCGSCKGVVLVSSKSKLNKLNLRKSQQGDIKLCACSQPNRSSSSSTKKVCRASSKVSTNIKILGNALVNSAYENISDVEDNFVPISQGKNNSKILRNLLSKPVQKGQGQKRKSAPKFNLAKYVEQIESKPGTSKQTEDVRIEVGDTSKFISTQQFMDISTPKFKKVIQDGKLNLQSPVCSQTDKSVFFDSFDFGEESITKETVDDSAAREFEALVDALDIEILSSSEQPTSRGSQLHTPTPPTNMPPHDATPIASSAIRQASPLSNGVVVVLSAPGSPAANVKAAVDEVVETPVSTISSTLDIQHTISSAKDVENDDDDDDMIGPSTLTQHQINGMDQVEAAIQAEVAAMNARLVEVQVARRFVAGLQQQLKNINLQRTTLLNVISSKEAYIAGGHSRVLPELCELERRVDGLTQRKIAVLEEIQAKGTLIRQVLKK